MKSTTTTTTQIQCWETTSSSCATCCIKTNRYVQSPLVIVSLVIVEFLVIVDRLSRQIFYFSMYFSHNSGITRYSGHFAADGQIHYYESRLYFENLFLVKVSLFFLNCTANIYISITTKSRLRLTDIYWTYYNCFGYKYPMFKLLTTGVHLAMNLLYQFLIQILVINNL